MTKEVPIFLTTKLDCGLSQADNDLNKENKSMIDTKYNSNHICFNQKNDGFNNVINNKNDINNAKINLYKNILVCNPYTLKYFLEFCITTFEDLNSPSEYYCLISEGLFYFIKKYRHPALFRVIYELINKRIDRIKHEIKSSILANIILIFDVFYQDYNKNNIIVDPELKQDWELKTTKTLFDSLKDVFKYNSGNTVLHETMNDVEPKASAESVINRIPSLEDNDDEVIEAFLNPQMFIHLEDKITNYLFDSFHIQMYNKTILSKFLQESSENSSLKGYLLDNVNVIEKLDENTRNTVLENLKDFNNVKWRYNKTVHQQIKNS